MKNIFFISLLFCVLFSATVRGQSTQTITVENSAIQINFNQVGNKLYFASILDKQSGYQQNFLNDDFLNVVIMNRTSALNSSTRKEVEYHLNDLNCGFSSSTLSSGMTKTLSLIMTNCIVPLQGTISFTLRIRLDDDTTRFSSWSITTDSDFTGNGYGLAEVRIILPFRSTGKSYATIPNLGSGILIEDPNINFQSTRVCGMLPTDTKCGNESYHRMCLATEIAQCTIPGLIENLKTAGTQLFTYYTNQGHGIYMAYNDTTAFYPKHFIANGSGTGYALSHYWYVANDIFEKNNFTTPYALTVGTFDGDWYDAALIYRNWSSRTPIVRKGSLEARTDVPLWWKEREILFVGVPLNYNFSNSADRTQYVNGFVRAKNFYNISDGRAAIFFFLWYNSLGDYTPPLWPGFDQLVREFENNGIHVILYTLSQGISNKTSYWNAYNLNSALQKNPDGKPLLVNSAFWNDVFLLEPDITTWQSAYSQEIVNNQVLGTMGATGIYYDNPYGQRQGDYSSLYGEQRSHPLGLGAEYIYKGYYTLMDTVRTAARAINPNFISLYEQGDEKYIPVADTMGSLGHSSFLGGNMVRNNTHLFHGVPITETVYHNYTVLGGGNENLDYLRLGNYVSSINAMVGPGTSWGKQFESQEVVFDIDGGNCMNFEMNLSTCYGPSGQIITDNAYFLKDLLEARRDAHKFLAYGTLMRPPVTDAPQILTKTQNYGGGVFFFQQPAVMSSVWKANDGAVGLYLVNYLPSPRTVRVTLPLAEYSLKRSTLYGAYHILQGGGLDIISTFINDTAITYSTQPLSSAFIEFIPLPRVTAFDGATTNFSAVRDIRDVYQAVLEKSSFGKIAFQAYVSFDNVDADSYVTIMSNNITVNTKKLPSLNAPATLTLRGLTFSTPKILKNGIDCPAAECSIVSYQNGELVFTVNGFSSYSAAEGVCIDSDGDGSCDTVDCNDTNATISPGSPEICDGVDNSCDGIIDEGCSCTDGSTQVCGSDVGTCQTGTQSCVNGVWGTSCDNAIFPGNETCGNGIDEDCNGADLQCGPIPGPGNETNATCIEGQSRVCGSHVGTCTQGTQTCLSGQWGSCSGATSPTTEQCDGLDNNCDGQIDDSCSCTQGQTRVCGSNIGECEQGTSTCQNGVWGTCVGGIDPAPEDICGNEVDDNCNLVVDENCGGFEDLCANGKQDDPEQGVDCGGKCPTSCAYQRIEGLVPAAVVVLLIISLASGLLILRQRRKGWSQLEKQYRDEMGKG